MMMRTIRQALMLGVLGLLLAACGGGVSEEDAENALESLARGEVGPFNDIVCERYQVDDLDTDESAGYLALGMDVSADCTREDDLMICDLESTFDPDNPDVQLDRTAGRLEVAIVNGELCSEALR